MYFIHTYQYCIDKSTNSKGGISCLLKLFFHAPTTQQKGGNIMNRKCLCMLLCLLLAFGPTSAIFAQQVVQTGEVQQIESAMDEQLVQMDIERKIAPVSYTHLDVYKRQVQMYNRSAYCNCRRNCDD